MSHLNVVIPYHSGDADLCVEMLRWIGELCGAKQHRCVLTTDPKSLSGTDSWPIPEKVEAITKLARKNFKSVQHIYTPYRRKKLDGTSHWPVGANWSFYCACLFMSMSVREPFLWMEPDCVPLKEGWLTELEDEYEKCGKPFMGAVLPTNLPNAHPTYLNGTAIYPANAMVYFDSSLIDFLRPVPFEQSIRDGRQHVLDVAAFDLAAAPQVVPHTHPTRLIQHYWGSDKDTPPTFKATKGEGEPPHIFTLESLYPEAVMFHRCKDSSLIDLLRERRKESKLMAA